MKRILCFVVLIVTCSIPQVLMAGGNQPPAIIGPCKWTANGYADCPVDTANFDGVLSATEDTLQKVLDRLDDAFYGYYPIPIAWMEDGTSPPDTIDDASTRPPYVYRTFASDADEDLIFVWFVPPDLSGSTIEYRVNYIIIAATGPTASEGVAFGLSGISVGDNDATNGTKGEVVVIQDDALNASQWDIMQTEWSGAVTITNLAAGEIAELAFNRDVSDTVDDYEQLVGVISVDIRYTKNPS